MRFTEYQHRRRCQQIYDQAFDVFGNDMATEAYFQFIAASKDNIYLEPEALLEGIGDLLSGVKKWAGRNFTREGRAGNRARQDAMAQTAASQGQLSQLKQAYQSWLNGGGPEQTADDNEWGWAHAIHKHGGDLDAAVNDPQTASTLKDFGFKMKAPGQDPDAAEETGRQTYQRSQAMQGAKGLGMKRRIPMVTPAAPEPKPEPTKPAAPAPAAPAAPAAPTATKKADPATEPDAKFHQVNAQLDALNKWRDQHQRDFDDFRKQIAPQPAAPQPQAAQAAKRPKASMRPQKLV